MAALPSVNASTYSATAGRQVVVVGWPAAAAAPSWATRSSALSWPVVISAAEPAASMTIFGVLGGLAAELPNSSTNGGEQFRADHGEADVRQLVVLGVLGDGVGVDVGLDAEGDDRRLITQGRRGFLGLGQLLAAVAAPRGEHLDEHWSAEAIGEGERHVVDVGDLQALPRGQLRRGRRRLRGVLRKSTAQRTPATRSPVARLTSSWRRRQPGRRRRCAEISGRIVHLPTLVHRRGYGGSVVVIEIAVLPRSARRWSPAKRSPGHRLATPWRSRWQHAWCGSSRAIRSHAR